MAGRRLSMRRTREILRQKWALGRSHREVARSLGVSTGAISAVLARARAAELSVTLVPDAEPEKGFFFRSDHFPFAKAGVPSLLRSKAVVQSRRAKPLAASL